MGGHVCKKFDCPKSHADISIPDTHWTSDLRA
jgi:hypothetical protein